MVQSGSTIARPARSSGACRSLSSGLAVLPAAQMTVCVGITQPAAATEPGRMSVTNVSVRTSTPRRRSFCFALSLRLGGIGREQPWPTFEQHHRGLGGVDVPEVAAERVAPDLGHRAGHLDAGRPAADDDEGEQGMPPHRIGLPLGALERQQHPAADLQGVFQALEPGREGLPLVVAEVRVVGAGGHDQVVVALRGAVGEADLAGVDVDAGRFGQQHFGVLRPAQDRADGRGDVARD